jgi:hypothetical protein
MGPSKPRKPIRTLSHVPNPMESRLGTTPGRRARGRFSGLGDFPGDTTRPPGVSGRLGGDGLALPQTPPAARKDPPISEDATVIRAYGALALIPTARTAFSYQPKDLKSVRRAVPKRFLLARVALCLP